MPNINLRISYEGTNADTLCEAFEANNKFAEYFDGEHVEPQVFLVAGEFSNAKQAMKTANELVWKINGGLYCQVTELTEEQFEEYC